MESSSKKFDHLVNIMAELRGPEGCPWDREQTHQSLRQYLLEETYEVLEALDNNDDLHLKEELGDLLLQVIFHAQIAGERQAFNIESIIESITKKLIRRHPNVFGGQKIKTSAEQSVNWERIKQSEKKRSTIDGVPKALSGLLRAWRIQQKASTVGFDWKESGPVWDKVYEELNELKDACTAKSREGIEEELGDLLFSIVNLSRFLDVNPEDALRGTISKFSKRFQEVEKYFENQDRHLSDVSLDEMDAIWEKIKQTETVQPDF